MFVRFCFLSLISLLIGSLPISAIWADIVYLKDKSVLHGDIVSTTKDNLGFNTSFMGVVTIPKIQIIKIEYQSDNVALLSELLSDKTYFNENMIIYETEVGVGGETRLATKEKSEEKDERKWKYRFGLNWEGKKGNYNTSHTGFTAGAKYEKEELRINSYLNYDYETDNGREVRNQLLTGLDYEDKFKMQSWYNRSEFEKARVKQIDYRLFTALGYGYYLSKDAKLETRIRLGGFVRSERYFGGDQQLETGLDTGFYNRYVFPNQWRIETDLTYQPDFKDLKNFIARHESFLEIPLDTGKVWNLRLGIRQEYDSMAAEGRKNTDHTVYMRIMLGWF